MSWPERVRLAEYPVPIRSVYRQLGVRDRSSAIRPRPHLRFCCGPRAVPPRSPHRLNRVSPPRPQPWAAWISGHTLVNESGSTGDLGAAVLFGVPAWRRGDGRADPAPGLLDRRHCTVCWPRSRSLGLNLLEVRRQRSGLAVGNHHRQVGRSPAVTNRRARPSRTQGAVHVRIRRPWTGARTVRQGARRAMHRLAGAAPHPPNRMEVPRLTQPPPPPAVTILDRFRPSTRHSRAAFRRLCANRSCLHVHATPQPAA